MPKQRYQRRFPAHDWQQIRPLLKDPAQIAYEIIRRVILWGETPKERAAATGMPMRTIYYKSNLFDQDGMASLLPPDPPPSVPKRDRRTLPPDIRQEIVNLHAEYPAFRPHELATICFVKFGRKPSPQTIKLVLATGPKLSRSGSKRDGAPGGIDEMLMRDEVSYITVKRLVVGCQNSVWHQ